MKIETPADFRFESAVCSHGFFMLAPNRWNTERRALHTTVPDDDDGAWAIVVDSPMDEYVRVRVPGGRPSAIRKRAIVRRVRRILRMDEDLSGFHRLCAAHSSHAGAARGRFGRLIRSASLFEDMVKVICTCNITWKQTVGIVDALVRRFGMPAENDPEVSAFPDANALASARLTALKAKCSLGYRAEYVRDLARAFVAGRVDPAALESCGADSDELYKTLRQIRGIGDYAAGCLLMLLGHYDRLAIDSETVRHFRKRFPRRKATPVNIRKHYQAYQPYAFLAYWYELWADYAGTNGNASEWTAEQGASVTRK